MLAILSIAIFAIPIIFGLLAFAAGVVLYIVSRKKSEMRIWSFISMAAGAVTAGVPAAILAFIFISDRVSAQITYDSLPGKAEVDVSMDRTGFIVDGVPYKQLISYAGRDIDKMDIGVTLVDGIYCHYPLLKLRADSPYELYYTDMFGSTYCREEDYDAVMKYYDSEAETKAEMKNMRAGDDYKAMDLELAPYNECYHIYHPYGLYNSVNESHIDTLRITLDDDYREYSIRTCTSDEIYETRTVILLQNDKVYIKYHGTDEEATVAELKSAEEEFYRGLADSFERMYGCEQ